MRIYDDQRRAKIEKNSFETDAGRVRVNAGAPTEEAPHQFQCSGNSAMPSCHERPQCRNGYSTILDGKQHA